jgi:hypothetical protein
MSEQAGFKERLIALDLLRFFSYWAIVVFQAVLFYFYSPEMPFLDISPILKFFDHYARTLAFSGFTIVLLSSFLVTYSRALSLKRARLFGVIALGWFVLSLFMNDGAWLSWDVYSLYFAGLAFYMVLKRGHYLLGWLGFILLWIPFWTFESWRGFLSVDAQHVFGLAPCVGREITEWPLLPWIGLVWVGSSLGSMARQQHAEGKGLMRWPEGLLWIGMVMASVPQWGAYFHIRIGPYFSCDAFRQTPLVFWSHMIGPLLIMRLAFDPRVQRFLARQSLARSISSLAISRHFWLAYIVQYVYLLLLIMGLQAIKARWPGWYDEFEVAICEFFGLTLIVQNELLARGALRVGAWLKPYGQTLAELRPRREKKRT